MVLTMPWSWVWFTGKAYIALNKSGSQNVNVGNCDESLWEYIGKHILRKSFFVVVVINLHIPASLKKMSNIFPFLRHHLLYLMSYQHTWSAKAKCCWSNWTLVFRDRSRCNLFCLSTFSSSVCMMCLALTCSYCSHAPRISFFPTSQLLISIAPFSPPHITVCPIVLWVAVRYVSMGTASALFHFGHFTVCVIKGCRFLIKHSGSLEVFQVMLLLSTKGELF